MEKGRKGDMKRKKGLLSRILTQNKQLIIVAAVVVGLSSLLLYKRSTYALSEGGKSATTILVPAGAGTIIGGAVGGGKWAAGGLGIGLGAGLVFNAIRKGRQNRAQRATNVAPYTPRRRQGRNHIRVNDESMAIQYPGYNQANGVNY